MVNLWYMAGGKELPPVAERVKERRRMAGLNQQQLADRSGLHYRTIQNVEGGKRLPSHDTLLAIAEALGVPVSDLAGAVSAPPRAYVDRFLMSDYARDLELAPDEIGWLRSLPEITWAGEGEPDNMAMQYLVLAYRQTKEHSHG